MQFTHAWFRKNEPKSLLRLLAFWAAVVLPSSYALSQPVNYENFADAIRQLGLFLAVIQVPDVAEH